MPAIQGGKYIVLGGASHLASHIGEQLLAGGARELVLLDNLSLGSVENIQPMLDDKRCRFVRADLLRLNELFDPLEGADGVFAVAAFMATPLAADPWRGLDVNVRGLQNALEACRYQRVRKVIYSSSTGVYGTPTGAPIDEGSPLHWAGLPPPMVFYCASKVMGEGLGSLYRQRHGIDFVALRYSAVYGERQHRRAVMGGQMVTTWERLRKGQPALIEGDPNRVQDYIHVADAARANLMAMESVVTGEAVNICAGVDTTQRRVLELVTRACGSTLAPLHAEHGEAPPRSVPRQAYSRAKAVQLLGWEPQIAIEDGIERIVRWLDRTSRDGLHGRAIQQS
jgi:UDP-glucose 4-epimerase